MKCVLFGIMILSNICLLYLDCHHSFKRLNSGGALHLQLKYSHLTEQSLSPGMVGQLGHIIFKFNLFFFFAISPVLIAFKF